MRDTDVGSAVETSQTTVDGGAGGMAGGSCWKKMTRNQKKRWKTFGGSEEYPRPLSCELGLKESCELGLIETNPPTGSTQNRESIGWPH